MLVNETVRPLRIRAGGPGGDLKRQPLTARIIDYLREADLPAGAHVTERALVDTFGVSRTPVRKALSVLSQRGVLRAERNRGFFLARPAGDLDPALLELEIPEGATLFDRIAIDRLNGGLPDRIRRADLAQIYGISQRRAQQALDELAEEGVVEQGNGAWRFSPALATKSASDASYAFRLAIEPQVPLLPTFAADPQRIRLSRDDHLRFLDTPRSPLSGRQAYRLNTVFHEMIADFGNNPFFRSAIAQQTRLRQLLEYRDFFDLHRVNDWCHEHMAILDALEAGDRPEASRLMAVHLRNALTHQPRPAT